MNSTMGNVVQKNISLFLALALTACSTEAPAGNDYREIVRTGYFEGDGSSGDWRAEYISGEDARMDLFCYWIPYWHTIMPTTMQMSWTRLRF